MPSFGSGYTFAEFLKRLERSPATHMAPLYHEHRELFVHRPDMFSKAIMSISWEKGLSLLQVAYYSQPIAVETYRAVLARMLLHNRHIAEKRSAGAPVPWKAALSLYSEAVLAHGTSLPTRVAVSTLRLMAPQRQWAASIGILKLAQANGQMTRPMLVDAARACATEAAWEKALVLLMRAHEEDPKLLSDSIQSLRPLGTDALTLTERRESLLDSSVPGGPTAEQWHIIEVLNDVVAAVPASVALQHPLCRSYLTHLVASTVLQPETKTKLLATAIALLPWQTALQLLVTCTEPELATNEEWLAITGGSSASLPSGFASDVGAKEDVEETVASHVSSSPQSSLVSQDNMQKKKAATVTGSLHERLRWLQCSPGTAAAMVAVMVSKLPDAQSAASFIEDTLRAGEAEREGAVAAAAPGSEGGSGLGSFSDAAASATAIVRHPAVLHALLRKCAETTITTAHTPTGQSSANLTAPAYSIATAVLLEQCGPHLATPTDVLSRLVVQLRQAKKASFVVRVLQEHIVPTQSTLTAPALQAVMDCVLAHNRAVRRVLLDEPKKVMEGESANGKGSSIRAITADQKCVHWLSALSWALDLQAPTEESRVVKTGTGPSSGAVAHSPVQVVAAEKSLSAAMLSSLIAICVDAGSPQGALRAMGYARRVGKVELTLADEIRAVLYCMAYDRPYEAEAIVTQAERNHGKAKAAPLRELLSAAQIAKVREQQ